MLPLPPPRPQNNHHTGGAELHAVVDAGPAAHQGPRGRGVRAAALPGAPLPPPRQRRHSLDGLLPLLLLELLWTALQLAGFRAIRRTRGTSASSSSSSSTSTSSSSPSASSPVGGGSPAGSSASFGTTAAMDAPSSPSYFSPSADPNESSSFAIDDDDMDLEFDEDAKPKNAADEAARRSPRAWPWRGWSTRRSPSAGSCFWRSSCSPPAARATPTTPRSCRYWPPRPWECATTAGCCARTLRRRQSRRLRRWRRRRRRRRRRRGGRRRGRWRWRWQWQ